MASDFLDNPPIEDLLKSFRPGSEDYNVLVAFLREMRTKWQRMLGHEFERMLESRQATEAYLNHPDPSRRLAALDVLKYHWGPDEHFAAECERLSFGDPDPKVRTTALMRLGRFYEQTNDPRVGKLLGAAVRDESMFHDCRLWAYYGLFQVRGVSPENRPALQIGTGEFRFPQDVDWAFVDSFFGKEKEGDGQEEE